MSDVESLVSINIPAHVAQSVGKVIGKLFCDMIPVLMNDMGVNLFTSADRPVDGTKYAVIGFRFDAQDFDLQIRAALRARGFTL